MILYPRSQRYFARAPILWVEKTLKINYQEWKIYETHKNLTRPKVETFQLCQLDAFIISSEFDLFDKCVNTYLYV